MEMAVRTVKKESACRVETIINQAIAVLFFAFLTPTAKTYV